MTVSIVTTWAESWISRSFSETLLRLDPSEDKELIDDLEKIAEMAEIHIGRQSWHPSTDGLVDDLDEIDTLDDLSLELQQIRREIGLKHIMIASVKEAGSCFARYRMLTTWPREWVQEYTDGMYQQFDPIFFEDLMAQPVLLHETADLAPIVRQYFQKAQHAGIGISWLIFWTEISEGTVIAVLLTSTIAPTELPPILHRIGWDLYTIADALAKAFARANGMTNPGVSQLTREELAVLRSVVTDTLSERKHTDASCAYAPPEGIRLCQKLGTRNLFQAAIATARTGLLTYAPFRMDEIWISEDTQLPLLEKCSAA